jgi:hypothetical protein
MERKIIQHAEAVYQDYTSLLVYTRDSEELEIELVREPEINWLGDTCHIRGEGYTTEYYITTDEFYGGMSGGMSERGHIPAY